MQWIYLLFDCNSGLRWENRILIHWGSWWSPPKIQDWRGKQNFSESKKLWKNWDRFDLLFPTILAPVFFGGNESQIKVLDLSTSKLLPGRLETAIEYIYSIQVCVISHNQIYLAVFGTDTHYSDDKTDLFEVSGLLLNSPVVIKNYLFEFLF